jgi:sugar phosphate isomerase/epimerase
MILGYGTNGFAHHRIEDAIEIIAEIGYRGVAITLEPDVLDPPDTRGVDRAVRRLAPLLRKTGLSAVIETGARFILDPRHKHQPTLVSRAADDRRRRIEFIKASIDVASALGIKCVSLWSGRADDDASRDQHRDRLVESMRELLDHARASAVRLGLEPEPDMHIERMAQFGEFVRRMGDPTLGLTLDVGHVHCLSDGDTASHVARWRDRLCNVHLEDMRRGVHEHLMFGDGDMDIAAVLTALRISNYAGPVNVESCICSVKTLKTSLPTRTVAKTAPRTWITTPRPVCRSTAPNMS